MKRLLLFLTGLLTAALLSGCSTAAMKGTPFYTGEYSVRQGPVEDRVNIWPVFYYRNPAMSALWPLLEKTEDHFALRPVYSLYGLDIDEPVHNILWPLAQFNTETGRNHIFPVYWSRKKDYFNVFPLYWHNDDPFGPEGGVNALFPLWIIDRDKGGYSHDFLWPFINFSKRKSPEKRSWRVWPLAGHKQYKHTSKSFYLWPLISTWENDKSNNHGSAVFPLYYYDSYYNGSRFFSLPYSYGSTGKNDSWKFTFPLFYHSKDNDGSKFVSIPYWRGNSTEKDEDWSMLAPLYYTKRKGNDRLFATLLGGYNRENEDTSWLALPLLSGGHKGPDSHDTWIGGPLAHSGQDGDSKSSHLFPLYFSSKSSDSSTFVSLPWSSGRNGDDSWRLIPLLYFGQENDNGSKHITPLYATGKDADNDRWHAVVPLYYRNEKSDTFASSLFVRFKGDNERTTTIIPPAFSWHSGNAQRSDLWLGGPLAHWSWGEEAGSRHILPLFYSDSKKDNFVSVLYSRWKSGDKTTRAVPPLLSWLNSEEKCSDLWLLGPMAHWSWGENAEKKHILPLFYSDKGKDKMISPLLAKWKDDDETHWACPPLLSWFSSDGKTKAVNGLLGVFNQSWGAEGKSGQLLPLYLYRGKKEVYTPLFGWDTSESSKYTYPLTPLTGIRHGDHAGGWLQPLGSYKRNKSTGHIKGNFLLLGHYWKEGDSGGSGMFPIYGYKNHNSLDNVPKTIKDEHLHKKYGKEFFCIPIIWYNNTVTIRPDYSKNNKGKFVKTGKYVRKHEKNNGMFPIWHHSSVSVPEDKKLDVNSSLLWLLYDSKYEVRKLKEDTEKTSEYTRKRILWRLWHYERLDGEVSVDMFPAITYDKKEDGFKRVSFLWKFFRYEREPDGNKKLDLLFLPIMR